MWVEKGVRWGDNIRVEVAVWKQFLHCGYKRDTLATRKRERVSGGGVYGGFPCPLPVLSLFHGQLPVT